MLALDQFKKSMKVDKIQFLKSPKTGREFATINTLSDNGVIVKSDIIKSKTYDPAKPKMVAFVAEKNIYVLCNPGVAVLGTEE